MRIKVIAEPTLTLSRERVVYPTSRVLTVGKEIATEARAKEILNTKHKGKPVAVLVEDTPKTPPSADIDTNNTNTIDTDDTVGNTGGAKTGVGIKGSTKKKQNKKK